MPLAIVNSSKRRVFLISFLKICFFAYGGFLSLHTGFLWLQQAGATLHCGLQASLVAQALGTQVSIVATHRLSCSVVCEIWDRGWNQYPLQCWILNHWTTREVPLTCLIDK